MNTTQRILFPELHPADSVSLRTDDKKNEENNKKKKEETDYDSEGRHTTEDTALANNNKARASNPVTANEAAFSSNASTRN